MIINPKVPRWAVPLLPPRRYKGAKGGRSGGKSHFFVEQVVTRMAGWHKTSRHERGYGSAWTRTRERVIARDKGLCQACLRKGVLTAYRKGCGFAVDHIKPKAKGGTDEDRNLQLLCKACHDAKTDADEGRKAARQVGLDGYPI